MAHTRYAAGRGIAQCGGFEVPTHLQRASHRNFKSKDHTRLISSLVSLRFRSSHESVPQGLANFGIGTLVPRQRAMPVRVAAALALVLALALALAGGANAQLVDCRGGQRPTQVAELMFGRNIGSRIGVSEGDFGRFVDREIMSRFPNGLTVFNAAGQWREQASDKIVREPSKVVQIVLPGQVDDIARLNEIVEAYKTRFKQQSVVMIVRPACVSF